MKKSHLDWSLIKWNDFETLTINLSQHLFKQPFFEKYLKAGNRQRGIDIRDINPDTKMPVYLQCKHEQLTIGKLSKLVDAFTGVPQWDRPCSFILATTGNLQTEALQYAIHQHQRQLKEAGVNWHVWDVSFLEQELKKLFELVQRFWGLETAQKYCWPPRARLIEYPAYSEYIPRQVVQAPAFGTPKDTFPSNKLNDASSLTDLLTAPDGGFVQICLIADAYEGKSIQLEQTANEILRSGSRFTPLLLRLKNTVTAPIETLLETAFDGWRTIPAEKLVILIDGLDEVPSNNFIEVINHLSAFIEKHKFIRILISCRKLFYYQYELPKRLSGVRFYELCPLSYKQVQNSLYQKLQHRKDYFDNEIRRLELEPFLAYPFYLLQLVSWFSDGLGNMPTSKMEVVNRFVDESIEISAQRRMSGGLDFDKHRARYKQQIKLLALAMQLAGKNALDQEEVQQLFPISDQELLQASSIISVGGKSWSFTNALFQEQLAAMALTNFTAEQIIPMITIGKKLRKIRIKWLQTLASYLSLIPENHACKSEILQLIEQDNIELLTLADASKFSPGFRLDIVQRIFNKYIQLGARPIIATDNLLAAFVRNDGKIIRYLLSLLEQETPEELKITVCRILARIQMTKLEIADYGTISARHLATETNIYLIQLMAEHISAHRLGSHEIKSLLFQRAELINSHAYRDIIYKYLTEQGEVDAHYDFGLEGLLILYQQNKVISSASMEANLHDFLFSAAKPQNVNLLLRQLSKIDWQCIKRFQFVKVGNFLPRLAESAKRAWMLDPSILESVVHFIVAIGRNHMKDEFRSFDRFFLETGTNNKALDIYLNLRQTRSYAWEFTDILTQDCFPLLIEYAQQGRLQKSVLQSFVSGLLYRRRIEDADSLQALIDGLYGKEPLDPEKILQNTQQLRHENNYRHLVSPASLREDVIAFFDVFGKTALDDKDLYLNLENNPAAGIVDSDILQDYLLSLKIGNQPIYLENVLEMLDNPDDFSIWRAEKLLDNSYEVLQGEVKLKKVLKDFYYGHISQADFANAIILNENGHYEESILEHLLCEIWKKHQFETPDDILLEMTWMEPGNLSGNYIDDQTTLANRLIQYFKDQPDKLRMRILVHMKAGIEIDHLLVSHIAYCHQLRLAEAAPLIFDVIESERLGEFDQYQAIDVLIKLGGYPRDLLAYLESHKTYNSYTFLHLVKVLREDFPSEVKAILEIALRDGETHADRKLEYARYLANLGGINGFAYIIHSLKLNNKTPFTIQQHVPIWEVETRAGLQCLESISFMLVDPAFDTGNFWESPPRLLMEILSGFAAKSEEDLLLVEEFMHGVAERYHAQFTTPATHLRWHAERLLNKFRESQQIETTVTTIKSILCNLSAGLFHN